jgi:hypothetical protein
MFWRSVLPPSSVGLNLDWMVAEVVGGGGVPVMNRRSEFRDGIWTGVSGELQSRCCKGYQRECIGGAVCVVILWRDLSTLQSLRAHASGRGVIEILCHASRLLNIQTCSSEVTKEAVEHENKMSDRALEGGVDRLITVKLPILVQHSSSLVSWGRRCYRTASDELYWKAHGHSNTLLWFPFEYFLSSPHPRHMPVLWHRMLYISSPGRVRWIHRTLSL